MPLKHTSKIFLATIATVLCNPTWANPAPWEEASSPQLEIRQYRFSRHTGFDRLVLEFERKDMNAASLPIAKADKTETPREVNIQSDNATLLGAIPESLINDSYSNKSRFLGPLTLNMDTPKAGFSMKAALKGGATRIEAKWIGNPTRLVIDAYGGGGRGKVASHHAGLSSQTREALSIEHGIKTANFDDLMCFPAPAKVNLTVIFKPTSNKLEEVQNIRVNTEGMNPQEFTAQEDAIVCYPKRTQILAALSFEEHFKRQTAKQENKIPSPEPMSAPPSLPTETAAAPKPPTPMLNANEADLEPGPPPASGAPQGGSLGLLPMPGGAEPRNPTNEGGAAPLPLPPSGAIPLSLLPGPK